MLVPSGLAGIRELAAEVLTGIREQSLVAVSVPSGATVERWLGWFLEALRDQTRECGEPLPTEVGSLKGSLSDPLAGLAAIESMERVESLEDLLAYFPDDGALIVVVACENILSPEWKKFFDSVSRAYVGANTHRLRTLIAIIVGSREYPPITQDVASRVFALWNVVRWEELRLLAAAVLPQDENALTRAWRVATYTGAANWDPDMLLRLCRESPDRLDHVVDLAVDNSVVQDEPEWNAGSVPERRWQVPATCIDPWASGELFGHTVERGAARAMGGMRRQTAVSYAHAAIWREQLSGLFPVVVELGFGVTSAVTSVLGTDWHREIPDDRKVSDGYLRLEPKEVMDILSTRRYGRIPQSIWSLLDLLRRTRNDLAHMSPIDLPRIRQIWQGHDLMQKRFGRS